MVHTTATAVHRAAGRTTAPIRVQAHRVQEAAAQAAMAARARLQEAEAALTPAEAVRREVLTTPAVAAVHAVAAAAEVVAAVLAVEDADKPAQSLL